MIHVDRSLVSPPPELLGERAQWVVNQARDFYTLPHEKRAQRRFEYGKHLPWLLKVALEPLEGLFHGKCAYCESRIGGRASSGLDRFRPKEGAVDLSGQRYPDHYGWLAFEWENLYLACPTCIRTKGPRFPVRGDRAPPGASWDDLRRERALLLDPCLDDPSGHFVFGEDGSVAAVHPQDLPPEERDRFGTPTRGQVTIDTFGLNRTELREARRRRAERFLDLVGARAEAASVDTDGFRRLAEELLTPDEEFLLMKQQLLLGWATESLPPTGSPEIETPFSGAAKIELPSVRAAGRGTVYLGLEGQKRAFEQQTAHEAILEQASVEMADEADAYRSRTAYIDRVEICGFTSMRDFKFDFVEREGATGGLASWLMLLGENGVGKSSVLRAIALALSGRRRLKELEAGVPMQHLPALFKEDGYVRVFLSSQREPLEVRRRGDRLEQTGPSSGAKVFVRAFGPSRWFPLPGSQSPEKDRFVRVENLFNPFIPLESPEHFLLSLDEALWDEVAASLKDLLQISRTGLVRRTTDGVEVVIPPDDVTPLRALSSGFEAVVAMTADLMDLLLQRWRSPLDAEGIVLLDEVGAHLHPRWKMRIVDSLRRTFPRVQFVATTHEPLCLRGLRQGEILLMKRDEADVVAYRPEQDVSELRIDQLLTSRMFGLHSTLDPERESELDRYYELLSRHETALKPEERSELEELRSTVGARGILGDTRRDQLIYQIIDEFVAREPLFGDEDERREQERLTKEQVAQFWSRIGGAEEMGV